MKIREYREKDQNEVILLWTECGIAAPQNDPVKDIKRKLKVDRDLFLIGFNENGQQKNEKHNKKVKHLTLVTILN